MIHVTCRLFEEKSKNKTKDRFKRGVLGPTSESGTSEFVARVVNILQ
jgi:hypothetical protein